MKKTLEQAAKEYAHELYTNSSEIEEFEIADAFKEGAEWQEKQSSWINVKETLPKVGETVLWLGDEYSEFPFVGELEENKQWITDNDISIPIKDNGDWWWMLIPEPYKE